jgi:CheY-like chemotaxis protein
LGLAISKGIVDAAGGRLAVESAGPASGASFTLDLPTRSGGPDTEAKAPAGAARAGHLHILLVEDDEDTRETLSELLRASDCEVQTAASVADAVSAFEKDTFDLVISDLGLPDGSGLDLIRKLLGRREVRAIALSGYGMVEDVLRSKEAGFAAHMTKPISFDRLMAVIRDVTT